MEKPLTVHMSEVVEYNLLAQFGNMIKESFSLSMPSATAVFVYELNENF